MTRAACFISGRRLETNESVKMQQRFGIQFGSSLWGEKIPKINYKAPKDFYGVIKRFCKFCTIYIGR